MYCEINLKSSSAKKAAMSALVKALLLIVVTVIHGINTQITGGAVPARLGQFKYVVAIWYDGRHLCGGALITNLHVLTAGHCLYKYEAPKFRIYAGIVNMDLDVPQATRNGKKIYIHGNYREPFVTKTGRVLPDFMRPQNDIGILVMDGPVPLTKYVGIIALPERDVIIGSLCSVAGWGQIFADSPELSRILLTGTATTITNEVCKVLRVYFVPDQEFCAIDKQKGTRPNKGDSGGPLVCGEHVVGIVAGGPNDVTLPEAYTNVWYYKDFITGVLTAK